MKKLLKRITYISILILTIISFKKDKPILESNININDLKDNNIKAICTYDYCDNLRGKDIKESIEIFMDKYLKRIKDEEIKNALKVKGIRVTKIIID